MAKKIKDLNPAEYNPRKISDKQLELLDKSMKEYGDLSGIVFNVATGNIIGGHQRTKLLNPEAIIQKESYQDETGTTAIGYVVTSEGKFSYREVNWTEQKEKAANIAANKGGGEWDFTKLKDLIEELDDGQFDLELTGFDDQEIEKLMTYIPEGETSKEVNDKQIVNKLTDRFIVPPFSILDTRQGYWQDRKKIWKDKICDKGETRESAVAFTNNKMKRGDSLIEIDGDGVSLLDPVLAEISCKWFGLENCQTFDCFAGDSIFGFVSSFLGNSFTGVELRQEQVDINNKRVRGFDLSAVYICDDGRNVLNHIKPNTQDLLFSCPPYFDLEVYSDLENDASNQKDYKDFISILDTAFSNAIKCLKENRFAVIVVGDVRDKKGNYYRFPDHIKDIFNKNNMPLYNELILVESLGTAMLRATKYMKNRKICKTHQNVLVFYKGDTKKIKEQIEVNIEGLDDSSDV